MKFTSQTLRTAVAAEYVLGNLRPAARRRFERALAGDESLRAEVDCWHRRLGAVAPTASLAPPDRVWARINRDLDRLDARVGLGASRSSRRRLRIWQTWSGIATAAALVLAVLVLHEGRSAAPQSPASTGAASDSGLVSRQPIRYSGSRASRQEYAGYAATLRLPQESSARWRIRVSPDTRTMRVESTGYPMLDTSEDYELWWVGDSAMVSVGLLPRDGGWEVALPRQVQMTDLSRLVITREPAYGSPADGPTGPVLLETSLRSRG